MKFTYNTKGVCSNSFEFEIENNMIKNLVVNGGCHGNLQGISALVEGMQVDEVIRRLNGIHCGYKETSCPDQLSLALIKAKEKMEQA